MFQSYEEIICYLGDSVMYCVIVEVISRMSQHLNKVNSFEMRAKNLWPAKK